jgi:nucleotide-binding universal stress UspA family protein
MSDRVTKKRHRGRKRGGTPRVGAARKRPAASRREARTVLVATDGSSAANAALTLSRLMEERGAWVPRAMTVVAPLPVFAGDVALSDPTPELNQLYADSLVAGITRKVRRFGSTSWNVVVEFGTAASAIVDRARASASSLIILGLGHHGKLARLFGAETVVRVIRRSDVPVLAVDARARSLPRTALVAVDFGASSIRAAREALALLEPPARVHLLHVQWALNGRSLREEPWEQTYAHGVAASFERLIETLKPRPGITMTSELRRGGVIETTLKVAKELGADVVAAGSHSQNVVDRLIIGSTPAHLLRAARCSVLIAPPDDLSAR